MERARPFARGWLADPRARDLGSDDSRVRQAHRQMIRDKVFLRSIYEEWYAAVAEALPPPGAMALELGSGGGFLKRRVAGVITSDVVPDTVDMAIDAHDLPFDRAALRGIVLVNVFHHLADVPRFLNEAARCVQPGGALVMLEPWRTSWSAFVYRRWHHEPFDDTATSWECRPTGPLAGANGALPWIVFERDRDRLEIEHPQWTIDERRLMMPFRYLMSGGVSVRPLMPMWTFRFWRLVERALKPWEHRLAMFALIVLRRTDHPGPAGTAAEPGSAGGGS